MEALQGATWFSTLDLKSGYWQVQLSAEAMEKTAFSVTGLEHWQFKVMPFGLCNAPATFERLMEHVLAGLSWKVCLVYLDDVIVYGSSFSDQMENLKEVLLRLRWACLKLSPDKCIIFQREVTYYAIMQLCINVFTGSNFKYVNNFMNVAERDSFDLQVPEVSCL
jgi:hypothetical protein